MIVAPYSKEELLKLRDRVDSARFLVTAKTEHKRHIVPGGDAILNRISSSLQRVDDSDYDANVLIEDLVGGGESTFIDGKYVLASTVFQMPLEKMPLLLNHVPIGIQTIAIWRLEIAR